MEQTAAITAAELLPQPFSKTNKPLSYICLRAFAVSWQRDLNPRPANYKSAALPA